MDFAFSEEQLAVSEAATGLFGGLVDPERVAAVEQTDDRIDRDLWRALADADLLGLAVPESEGGAAQGLLELCLLLEAQGNAVAPVPLWATLVLGALPLARFGIGRTAHALAARCRRRRRLPHGRAHGHGVEPHLDAAGRGRARRRRLDPRRCRALRAPGPPRHARRRACLDRERRPARTGGPAGRRRRARAHGDHQPRDPPTPAPRAAPASRPDDVLAAPHAGRAVLDDLLVGGHHRPVRAPGRRLRGGADADGRLPQHAPAVRPSAQHVPGHDAAGGRRRDRHRGDARHLAERGLAATTPAATHPSRPAWPSGRRPNAANGPCTRRSISMAAWARTSPIRSIATSSGGNRSSCCWADRARSCPSSVPPSPPRRWHGARP